jgi:hypothetical protein
MPTDATKPLKKGAYLAYLRSARPPAKKQARKPTKANK